MSAARTLVHALAVATVAFDQAVAIGVVHVDVVVDDVEVVAAVVIEGGKRGMAGCVDVVAVAALLAAVVLSSSARGVVSVVALAGVVAAVVVRSAMAVVWSGGLPSEMKR